MAGPKTYYKAIVQTDNASLDDNNPVSVMRAWAVRNNTQHLIDQFPQHRINWASSPAHADYYTIFADSGDRTVYYTHPFVHTALNDRHPCGLDLRICGRRPAGADTVTVDARVVPNVPAKPWDLSIDSYIGTVSGSVTSATSVQVLETQWQPSDTEVLQMFWQGVTVPYTSSTAAVVQICMSRLELKLFVPNGCQFDMTMLHLREYC